MGLNTGLEQIPSFDSWARDIMANYGGSERKDGRIGPDGVRYMIKYAEKQAPRNDLATSYVNNVLSEYVASHVLNILGYPVHETRLGRLNGEFVVACRNFVPPDSTLLEFGTILRKHYDSGDVGRIPDIAQIYNVFETDPDLAPQQNAFKRSYWERFVGDALIGNFDRHKGNFGYLVCQDGSVTESPIYDNGSTLFPNLSESGMAQVLSDPKEIMQRIKVYPKAALEANKKKVSYYDMMASGIYQELTAEVITTVPRLQAAMPAAQDFIRQCGFLSDTRKNFYSVMLAERMHFILEEAYTACASRKFDLSARHRIAAGGEYTLQDFEGYWRRFGHNTDGRTIREIRDQTLNENLKNLANTKNHEGMV